MAIINRISTNFAMLDLTSFTLFFFIVINKFIITRITCGAATHLTVFNTLNALFLLLVIIKSIFTAVTSKIFIIFTAAIQTVLNFFSTTYTRLRVFGNKVMTFARRTFLLIFHLLAVLYNFWFTGVFIFVIKKSFFTVEAFAIQTLTVLTIFGTFFAFFILNEITLLTQAAANIFFLKLIFFNVAVITFWNIAALTSDLFLNILILVLLLLIF